MFVPFDYECPFCGRLTTLTLERFSGAQHVLTISNVDGPHMLASAFRVCPNPKCEKFSLIALFSKAEVSELGWKPTSDIIKVWNLIPQSSAKAFPEYIPKVIREDYEEACLIKEGSPKASATLSRRCLQGMIRDFWGLREKSLKNEIDALKGRVGKKFTLEGGHPPEVEYQVVHAQERHGAPLIPDDHPRLQAAPRHERIAGSP